MILYLDMDGVLMDFEGAIKDHGVVPYLESAKWLHRPHTEWPAEMLAADAAYVKVMDSPDFWSSVKPMPDAYILWNYARLHNPHILTATPNKTEQRLRITRQKQESIWTYFDPHLPVEDIHICLRHEKQTFAHPGAILVDDNPASCKEWAERGGVPVLHKDAMTTIRILREILNV